MRVGPLQRLRRAREAAQGGELEAVLAGFGKGGGDVLVVDVADEDTRARTVLAATSEGQLIVHPLKVKAAGIPATKLMGLFGVELQDLIKARPEVRSMRR